MCLKPIRLRNPTEKISPNGGQPLLLSVPCGKCSECKKNKRLEWYFRSYYECLGCVKKSGFVYFDTLTYRDKDLPRLSHFVDMPDNVNDFMCFNYAHFRDFIKNLRSYLSYNHKGVSFKYFMTSEYGTDERYTHRPHYHLLFFVFGPIDPLDFSRLISRLWQYGRTDGLPYKETSYVLEHIYSGELSKKVCTKVCNYVSKYVTKDSTFQKELDNRLSLLSKHFDADELKVIRKSVDMFHRQSQGFGSYYLESMDKDEKYFVKKNFACRMEDSEEVKLCLKLPLYYKRKMFYKCLRDSDNKVYWQLNKLGYDCSYDYFVSCINRVTNHIKDVLFNCNDEYFLRTFNNLLDGRDIEDFVIYKLFYKGRLRPLLGSCSFSKMSQKYGLSDEEYNLYDWLHRCLSSSFVRSSDYGYNVTRDVEQRTIVFGSSYGSLFGDVEMINVRYDAFLKSFLFNEDSCYEFRYFDRLDFLYESYVYEDFKLKEGTFEYIEDLKQKFKHLINLVL